MRVGDKSRKLNFDERMQLMYDKGERNYKDEAAYGATIDDVDMAAVNDYTQIIGYGKSAMEYLLQNNDFVKEVDGKQKVSNACVFGAERTVCNQSKLSKVCHTRDGGE